MNHVFKSVLNSATGTFVAVPETAKCLVKTSSLASVKTQERGHGFKLSKLTKVLFAVVLGVCLSPSAVFASAAVIYTGNVTPNQTGANWTISGNFTIGQNSAGTLDILDGGSVQSGNSTIGQNATGEGTVNVDGLGSSWSAARLDIGNNGAGILNISNQAKVTASASVNLGRSSAGSSGTLLIDGAGSSITSGDAFTVGNSGFGEMTISNGANVTSDTGYIGRLAGSTGTVLVTNTGSHWHTSSFLYIGNNGDHADLIVSDGGKVSADGVIDVGRNTQVNAATALITGADSKLITARSLNVGRSTGSGILTAADGAQIITQEGYIGRESTATGLVRITDNASWNMLNNLYVGFDGNGTLEASSGGSLRAESFRVGVNAGSIGHISLSDLGTELHTDTEIVIGDAGVGSLSLDKGAVLIGDSLVLAKQAGSSGTLHLRGSDADGRGVLAVGQLNHTGSGTAIVDFDGGVLRATRDEADYLGNFTSVNLNTGGIVFDSNGFDLGVNAQFSGVGGLIKQGVGSLTLNSVNNSYSGVTEVRQGVLRMGAADALSSASSVKVASDALLDLAGYNQSIAGLNLSGTLAFGSPANQLPNTRLTVTGAFVGQNGILAMSTVLGDDNSATDRLILSGPAAIASGQTIIRITDVGGLGAKTTGDGIVLVDTANGASLDLNSFSLDGSFIQAGAYEYRLFQNEQTASLRSELWQRTPANPLTPPTITYRAGVALLSALPEQLRQADLAMLGNLEKRIGSSGGQLFSSATQGPRIWTRVIHISPRVEQTSLVSTRSHGALTGLQIGADLYSAEYFKTGLYVGQLEGKMDVTGFVSGIDNKKAGTNHLRNRYIGLYGTWQSDSGLYTDVVLQRADYHSRSKEADALGKTAVNGHGWLASVELGKPFALSEQWQVQPELQVIYRKLHLDNTSLPAAKVKIKTDDDWLLRIGARVSGNFETAAGRVSPYARVNLYKSTGGSDVASFTGPVATTSVAVKTGYQAAELALGGNWQVSNNTQIYGEVGRLWHAGGSNSRVSSGTQFSLGVKVNW